MRYAFRPATCCLYCQSPLIRQSKRRGLLDRFISLFTLRPYRCNACYKRFWYSAPAEEQTAS